MSQYNYTKSPVNNDRLIKEIFDSSITVALDYINIYGSAVTIYFKAPLSNDEEIVLNNIISDHTGLPLPSDEPSIKITSMPSPSPFATPTFRTKRNATESTIEILPGGAESIDFLLTVERYVSGGALLIQNGEFGDYITAEVHDPLEVIPVAYRAALCENWPTIATYIEKEFVEIRDGVHCIHKIDTYPLNAKITAGLCLRITYHAINSGNTRKICANYNLTKKL